MPWYDLVAIILLVLIIGYWLWTISTPIYISKKDLKNIEELLRRLK